MVRGETWKFSWGLLPLLLYSCAGIVDCQPLSGIFIADTWSEDTRGRIASTYLLHSCASLHSLRPCQPTGHLWFELAHISLMLQGYNQSFPVFCMNSGAQSLAVTSKSYNDLWKKSFGERKKEKREKCSLFAQLDSCSLPVFPSLSHRFHTWGFVHAKNWETRVFGSLQTPPSSLSHMDQLEALTGEKPYYRNRQSYPSKENPWPF